MANQVSARSGGGAQIFELHVGVSNGQASVDGLSQLAGPSLTNSASAERIIIVDWAAATGIGIDLESDYDAGAIAGLIEPYLVGTIPAAGVNNPFAESPIHLIGHSRGASLVSALAGDLGRDGIWVDQLTTLDPHPVYPDPSVVVSGNVLFADNYYETDAIPISGSAVAGAHETNLTGGGWGHSGIHDYYENTIAASANYGFGWSLLGATARPSDGVYSAANTSGGIWDNITILNQTSSISVAQGTSIPVQTRFLDSNKNATITLRFDSDANPYKGSVTTGSASTANTTVSGDGQWNPSLSTSSLAPGTYRIFATIANGSRTRYFYAPGKVTITAIPDTTKPVASATVSNVTVAGSNSFSFSVTYSDNIGVNVSSIGNPDIRVTGPNGFSQFATLVGLDNGTNGTPRKASYRIRPPGGTWDVADNGTYTLTLQAGEVTDTSGNAVSAGTLKTFTTSIVAAPATGTISGVVFYDGNGNGIKDSSERTALPARIYLDLNKNGSYDSASEPSAVSSAKSGNYALGGVAPGTYYVRQVLPSGYRQTLGNYTLVVSAGQNQNGKLFGDTGTFVISGTAFNGLNSNKAQNAGEKGLRRRSVFLDANNDGILESKTELSLLTNSKGSFAFSALPPGKYALRIVPQTGWNSTTVTFYSFNFTNHEVGSGKVFGQKK